VGSRYAIFVALAVLCSGRLAIPQVLGTELAGCAAAEVVGGKEPAVQVTDSEGKVLASIPVGLNPGAHAYSKSTNTLYVVHDYKKLEHHISAVNLTTRRVDKEIEVGAGEVDLHLSRWAPPVLLHGGKRRHLRRPAYGAVPQARNHRHRYGVE